MIYYSVVANNNSEQNLAEHHFDDDLAFRSYMDRKAAERKLARKTKAKPQKKTKKTKQRRAKKTPEIEWLKELICPFVYGERTPDGVRPSVTKDSFIGRWNMSIGLPSLPNY